MSAENPFGLRASTLLAGIRKWVEIESPSDDKEAVNRMMDLAESEMEQIGLSVTRIPMEGGVGDCLRGCTAPKDKRPGVLIMSHLDTVHPVGTLGGPLKFRVDGDRAYGPGIADMKGGAWIGLNAVRELLKRKEATPLPVIVLLTSDEELGSRDSRALIEAEGAKAKYVLVTEPGRDGGYVVTGRRGGGRYRLEVTGRAAHSGVAHQDGRSAVLELAQQIVKLEAMTDYDRGISINVGTIGGGTKNNVVPAHAWAGIDLRVTKPADAARMEKKITGLKPIGKDITLAVTGWLTRPPFSKNTGIEALYQHTKNLAAEIGLPLPDTSTGGGSDGNFTAALGIPTLDGLGATGAGIHTHDEHILVSHLIPRQTLMMRLLQTLA